jgi:hypothetical protein
VLASLPHALLHARLLSSPAVVDLRVDVLRQWCSALSLTKAVVSLCVVVPQMMFLMPQLGSTTPFKLTNQVRLHSHWVCRVVLLAVHLHTLCKTVFWCLPGLECRGAVC